MPSTYTIQQIVNLASTHIELMPLAGVGGYSNEPAISLANDVLQKMTAPPLGGDRPLILDWKFNRAEMNMLVTSAYRQDYLFAGASFFCLNNGQSAGIDLASNTALSIVSTTVTIKLLERYNGAIGDACYVYGTGSNYDSTLTQNASTSTWGGCTYTITAISSDAKTITATVSGGSPSSTSGAAGITDFGWLAAGTMVGLYSNAPILPTRHIEATRNIQPWGYSATPEKVCVLQDLGTGVLKIRFYQVPGTVQWGVNLVYQKKAPLKTALSDTWSPFPDELSYVFRQGFLAMAYRYYNSPKADVEDQKFEREMRRALGDDDQEANDVHLYPAEGLVTSDWNWWGGV